MLNSRLKNRLAYGGLGTIDLFKRTWKDLTEYINIIVSLFSNLNFLCNFKKSLFFVYNCKITIYLHRKNIFKCYYYLISIYSNY